MQECGMAVWRYIIPPDSRFHLSIFILSFFINPLYPNLTYFSQWYGGGWEVVRRWLGVVERWCVYLFIFIIYTQLELLLFPMCVCDDVCGEDDVFCNLWKQV